MENKKAIVKYLLNEEGRKQSLLSGGDGKEVQVLEIDATPEIIQLAKVTTDGDVFLSIGFSGNNVSVLSSIVLDVKIEGNLHKGYCKYEERGNYHFSSPQAPEVLLDWERNRLERISRPEIDTEYAKLRAEYAKRLDEQSAIREEQDARRREGKEAREKALEAEKEGKELEKRTWIDRYGSDHLKKAVGLGYNCQRLYVEERVLLEHPNYTVDFDDVAEWKERSCPSKKALDELESVIIAGANAEIVWLTKLPHNNQYNDCLEFEGCEAVVQRQWLGKYDLIKIPDTHYV